MESEAEGEGKDVSEPKRVLICCWDCKKHLGCRGVAAKPTQCIDYEQQPKRPGPERPPDRHWYRTDINDTAVARELTLLQWAKRHSDCADLCLECPLHDECDPVVWQGFHVWPCEFIHQIAHDLGVVAELEVIIQGDAEQSQALKGGKGE